MVGLRATAGRVVAGLRSLLAALLLAWLLPISSVGAAVSPGAVAPDTGEYFSEDDDLVLPDTGPPRRFVRSYNSLDTRVMPLGPGWIFNFHSHISNPGLGTLDLVVVAPQGRSDVYTHTPDGAYRPPPGVHAALQKNVDNTYTLTMPDGGSEFFDGFGNLRQLTDPQGHQTDLGYELQLHLVTVRDAGNGAGFDFAYDPTGARLLSVSTAAAPIQVVHYAYDSAGRLSTVTAADGRITRYTYAGSSIRVNAVLDGQGTPLLQIAYDAQGRVTSELEGNGIGNGQPITFTYVKQPDGGLVTTITYPPILTEAGWRPIRRTPTTPWAD